MLRILERRNTTLILQCYLKRPADKVADFNLTVLIYFFFICFYGHRWQPFIFNILLVFFGQETKWVLFSPKDLKQKAWSKASCSFHYAYQFPGAVSNGTTGGFFSMHKCAVPSRVNNSPKRAFVILLLWPKLSERIWREFLTRNSLIKWYSVLIKHILCVL